MLRARVVQPADENFPVCSCGFAGGIGVDNISAVLDGLRKSARGETVWVDMESSLRQDGAAGAQDIFAMDRVEKCCRIVIGMGFGGDGGDRGSGHSAASL